MPSITIRAALAITIVLAVGCADSTEGGDATPDASAPPPIAEVARVRELPGGGTVSDVRLASPALGLDRDVVVYEPAGIIDDAPVASLYLLHGQEADEQQWHNLGVFRAADELIEAGEIDPVLIVLPDIDNSFGVNNEVSERFEIPNGPIVHYDGGRYEDFLAEDLIAYVDAEYPTIADREHRSVGGISMGGFAALHLAFRHPDLFTRVGGHSAALVDDPEFTWLYPPGSDRAERDPFALAEQVDPSALDVHLDVGEQDEWGFLAPTVEMAELLERRGVDVELVVEPGRHDATYWSSNVEEYLRFYAGTGD